MNSKDCIVTKSTTEHLAAEPHINSRDPDINSRDYARIAEAIEYVATNVTSQPSLEQIARHIHLSPHHAQRLFSRWAGVSPKQFLQVLTLENAKVLLQEPRSLLNTSDQLGLTSTSRLYDHFVKLEAMTPGEYKKGGGGLTIDYGVHETLFGKVFIATTERGICRLEFLEESSLSPMPEAPASKLLSTWPNATIRENPVKTRNISQQIFSRRSVSDSPLDLYLSGTNFQINVWKALLRLPFGALTSYAEIAKIIHKPKAVRAVGTAIGANPIGYIIPCHRVIRQTGALGGYRWGLERKRAILTWEQTRKFRNIDNYS